MKLISDILVSLLYVRFKQLLRQCSKIFIYPLELLLPGNVNHLLRQVSKTVLQGLHAVLGPISIVTNCELSHLYIQM